MNEDSKPERGQGDYQYLVSLDDRRALSKIRVAEKITGRLIERDSNAEVCRKNPGMVLVKTFDDRGPISGLSGDLMHAQEWQYPFGPGYLGRVGIKYQKAKGAVKTYDCYGGEHTVHVEVDTGMTMTEMKENPGQVRRIVEDAAADKWCEVRDDAWDEEVPA